MSRLVKIVNGQCLLGTTSFSSVPEWGKGDTTVIVNRWNNHSSKWMILVADIGVPL